MSRSAHYDETGSQFVVFALSLLAVYLVPATISRVWRLVAGKGKGSDAAADGERDGKAAGGRFPLRHVIFAVAWVAFIALFYLASKGDPGDAEKWNPYTILGVDESATPEAVRKAYRTLSLRWHPDKNQDNQAEAEQRIVDINKAYEVLTNAEARAIWERTGGPDDTREFTMGIALPKWMVQRENTALMLVLYMAVLLAIVAGVYFFVRRARKFTTDDMLQDNKLSFQRDMFEKNRLLIARQQKRPPRPGDPIDKLAPVMDMEILHFLGKAPEFLTPGNLKEYTVDEAFVEEVFKNVQNFPKPVKTAPLPFRKAMALLCCHLYRMEVPFVLRDDYKFVVTRSLKLLRLLVDLEQFHKYPGYFPCSVTAIKVHQMMVQALWERELRDKTCLVQLPHMNNDDILAYCLVKPKKEKDKVKTIAKLLEKPEEERRHLLQKLDDQQYALMMAVAQGMPFIEITTAEVFVSDEAGTLTDLRGGDIVTLKVVCSLVYGPRKVASEAEASPTAGAAAVSPALAKPAMPQAAAMRGGKRGKTRKPDAKPSSSPAKPGEDGPVGAGTDGDDSPAPADEAGAAAQDKDAEGDKGAADDKEAAGDKVSKNDDDDFIGLSKKKPEVEEDYVTETVPVLAPSFPQPVTANFWIFVVDPIAERTLECREFKTVQKRPDGTYIFQMELRMPTPPTSKPMTLKFSVHALCDAYIGCDAVKDIEVKLRETLKEAEKEVTYVEDEDEDEAPLLERVMQSAGNSAASKTPAKLERVEDRESDDEE